MKSQSTSLKKITRGFQLTLPKGFREKFDLNEGDYLEVVEEDERLVLRPIEIRRKQTATKLKKVLSKAVKTPLSKLSEEKALKVVEGEIKKHRKSKLSSTSGK